jgi:transposase
VIPSVSLGTGRTSGVRIWLATAPVDMRRSFDRLAEHVRTILSHDPTSGHLFVFRNRSGERVKILWWDRDGYVLYYKRLERGTFQFPAIPGKSVAIGSEQLKRLLNGCAVELPT